MARIQAFRPYIYAETEQSDISRLIAPPYDVIKSEALQQLKEDHPHNITYLTLPEGEGDRRYAMAGRILEEWRDSSILVQRPRKGLYPYTQRFVHPETGDEITRTGLIALLELEPFDKGIVLPHELTLKGPREDRLRLMEETNANLESIFGMFPDPDGKGLNSLQEFVNQHKPLIETEDQSGITHTLWEATGEEFINELASLIEDLPVYIVDGHHRYETALNYRQAWHQAHPEAGEDTSVDSIMIYLTPMSDPGLIILPTHRIVDSLASFDINELRTQLANRFEIVDVDGPEEGFAALDESDNLPSFLLMNNQQKFIATLKPDVAVAELVGEEVPPPLASLDVTILHRYIFERLLGIDRAAQELQTNLRYAKSQEDAIGALDQEETQLVVGMNPTKFAQVEDVAHSGDVMPQKSTYFYPKLASGLLLHLFSGGNSKEEE